MIIKKVASMWSKVRNSFENLAVDISSESEPEELEDLEDLEDIKVDDQELNDLDKLIATTKSIPKI